MTIDLSRDAHQPAKRYTSVRLQQGKVILDDDWNESESITVHERVESLVDVIGPSGSSDDALLVTAVNVDGAGEVDLDLGGGTFYVGGRRLLWPAGHSYRFQDSYFGPPVVDAPVGDRNDLVWVEVSELPVTAAEDAELREVGLGGPDTAARTRLVARVMVETDTDEDCERAFESTVGADVDERGRLTTDATLTVGFVDDGTPEDLCTPAVAGGYLSHLNQAIRVQCIDATHVTWSFDNASDLYRVELQPDRTTVKFRGQPVDDAHWPRSGQVVELLPWAAVLPNGQLQAAELGHLAVVDVPYDPDSSELTLTAAAPAFGEDAWIGRPDQAELEADGRYVYLRVWERGEDTSAPELSFASGGAAVPLGTTGLEVSFTGTTFRPGDHWIIAARPAEPRRVVPWDFDEGRLPHGPVRLRAPLATIRWRGGVPLVHDCRRRFRPLTELQGCCDITVGDGSSSFGDVESIQEAVDLLPPEGGTICVRSGVYDERVTISDKQHVEIHGCGNDSVVAPSDEGGPVFTIDDSADIELASLQIVALDAEGVRVGFDRPCLDVRLDKLEISASPFGPGVLVDGARRAKAPTRTFAMRHCTVDQRDLEAPPREGEVLELWPAVFVQGRDLTVADCRVRAGTSRLTGAVGGIQVGGRSRDVVLARNLVEGGNGNGITLGSIAWIEGEQIGLAVSDLEAFEGRAVTIGTLVWFDGGCIHIDGDPVPDPEGDDPPMVPVSVGPVVDLVIEDNEIRLMAADGIGVARFFEPGKGEESDIILVARVRIDRNVVEDNRRTAPATGSPALVRLSGHGGIALAEVIDLRARDNRIVGNGSSDAVPLCGLFVLAGESLLVTGNDIADNGADPVEGASVQLGNRGGIVVRSCRGGSVGQSRSESPEIGALLIHGNRVSQSAGQAIWAMGLGQMSVHDNQLSAGHLGTTDIVSAILRMLESDFDNLDDVASIALTHFVGLSVTLLNLGLPIDVLGALGSLSDMKSHVPGSYAVATSSTALQTDEGEAAYDSAVAAETRVARPVHGVDDLRRGPDTTSERLLQGGHVSFADNQVTLDLLDSESSLALCSVLLGSFDDVAMHDNQVRCLTERDLVLVDAVAFALWTQRCQGNRLQEIRARLGERAQLGTFLSLLSFAALNVTTGNICSAPHVAGSFSAAFLVDEQNLEVP